MVIILRKPELVIVDIFYYMPDHELLLQEFLWQTEDTVPDIPRVHRFLNFWKNNIEATIQQVIVSNATGTFRTADGEFTY